MSIVKQVLCTLIVCLLMMNMGMMYAWPSSTIQLFSSTNTPLNRPMTDMEQAVLGSLFTVVALISTPLSGLLLEVLGRKKSCILFTVPQVIAWMVICISDRVEVIFAAVCISGMSTGLFTVVPIYVSEISQETVRGTLTAGANVFWGVGVMVSYISGCFSYQMMNYANLLVTALGSLLLVYMKESPVYLMSKRLDKEAAKSIAFYRSVPINSKEVCQEMTVISRALNPQLDDRKPEEETLKCHIEEPKKLSQLEFLSELCAIKDDITLVGEFSSNEGLDSLLETVVFLNINAFPFIAGNRSSRLALFLVFPLTFCSVFQGVVAVQVYAQPMFEEALPGVSGNITGILFTLVGTIAGVIAAYFLDLFGRRPLIIYPSIAAGLSCLALGSQIQYQWGPSWLTGVFIFSYSIAYTFGGGTVPYVVIAEIFLPEIRSALTMLTLEWAWVCNFLILFAYGPLVGVVGLGGVFHVFAACCFLTAALGFYRLPETNGQTVDVIQALLLERQ